jgi:hypothetical protein
MMRKIALVGLAATLAILWATVLPAAGKPDLAVAAGDIAFAPSSPSATAPLAISATVRNLGSKPSKPTQVKFLIEPPSKKAMKGLCALEAVPAGGAVTVQLCSFEHLDAGSYLLTVKVDPRGKIREGSKKNNSLARSFDVTDTNPFVGQAAAAAFGSLSRVTGSVLDALARGTGGLGTAESGALSNRAAYMAALLGQRPEAAQACDKSGAFDYTFTMDFTHIRPGSVLIWSPAPEADPCEEWLSQTGMDPDLGSYSRILGRLSFDISYQSASPLDPGFLKPSRIVLKTGDGVPGTANPLPDLVTELHRISLDEEVEPLDRLVATQDADYTAEVAILGYGADSKPDHIAVEMNGLLAVTGEATGKTLNSTFSAFKVEATFLQDATGPLATLVTSGSITLEDSQDPSRDVRVDYHDLRQVYRMITTQTELAMDGSADVTSSCITGTLSVATLEPVVYPKGETCPASGKVSVSSPLGAATLLFYEDGSLGVDDGSDGTVDHTYPDCLVPPELPCS